MDARVIFTKEFNRMTKQNLTTRKRRELAFEKLKEANKAGLVEKAKSRRDIVKLAGLPDNHEEYLWVCYLIKKGVLLEMGNDNGTNDYMLVKDEAFEKMKGRTIRYPRKRTSPHLLNARLLEAYDSGRLSRLSGRDNVAQLLGYNDRELYRGRRLVNSWIKQGKVVETANEDGTFSYRPKGKRTLNAIERKPMEHKPVSSNRVTIEKDGVKIIIEDCTAEFVRDIIK